MDSVKMKINIPCPACGCMYCCAETKLGEKVKIEICTCSDGSGDYDVTIYQAGADEPLYEKHQCSQDDLADCLETRYKIDTKSINHQCN
jgi:hypothetical protein